VLSAKSQKPKRKMNIILWSNIMLKMSVDTWVLLNLKKSLMKMESLSSISVRIMVSYAAMKATNNIKVITSFLA